MGQLGRIGVRIANAVLFVLCCYLTADVINRTSAELLTPAQAAPAAVGSAPLPSQPSWSDHRVILDRNLFGAQLGGAAPPPPEPSEKLEETKLPLRLLGTAASHEPAFSIAAIQDQSSKTVDVVRIGDRLESYKRVEVAGIERKRVILRNGNRREELLLDEDAPKAKARPRTARRRPTGRGRSQARLSSRLQSLREKAKSPRTAGARNPASLFSDARILPKYENGAMVGIQLNSIKRGSLYQRLGFEDGDVITSLNDIKIDNPAASARLLSELTEANDFVFEKIGPNGPEKFTVSADQVAEILGEL